MAAALLAALAVSACGSSHHSITNVAPTATASGPGEKSFSAPGMAIHFRFPASFRTVPLAPSKRVAGNTGHASHAAIGHRPVRPADRDPVPEAAGAGHFAEHRPAEAAVRLPRSAPRSGASSPRRSVTIGGLPALSYPPAPVVGLPTPASSRITNVFFGDDQYELNCQYTPKAATTITAACDEMLSTLSAGR